MKNIFNNHKLTLPGENIFFDTLENGLKVCHKQVASAHVAHCGFIIHAGSRDDNDLKGIAHCMEHMLFKGTKKRKSFHILNRLDSVGGEINAYTTKELTAVYASIYDEFLGRAIELMVDIITQSSFPEKELTKEKKVIKEEIKIYQDSPDDCIFDDFQEQIFANHALNSNILGTEKTLNNISTEQLFSFAGSFYQPNNMVFFICSDLPHKTVLKTLKKNVAETTFYAGTTPSFIKERKVPSSVTITNKQKETDHQQAYIMLGGKAAPYNSPQKNKQSLLINLLGGPALNSRLNLTVREKQGLAYHIEAGNTHFTDIGFYHTFAGTDAKNVQKLTHFMLKEMQNLKKKALGTIQLNNVTNQYIGQVMVAQENNLASIMTIAKQWLLGYEIKPLVTFVQEINEISAHDLLETAQVLFDDNNVANLTFIPSPE